MGRRAGVKNVPWDDEWLLSNYEPTVNLMDLRRLYNSVHGTEICEQTFRGRCRKLGLDGQDNTYTEEEDRWLLEHYNEYGGRICEAFNEAFSTNRPRRGVMSRCRRIGASAYRGIDWDDLWIIERWEAVRNWLTLCREYNAEHGTNVGYNAFKAHCNGNLGLNYHYTEEQDKWLIENFPHKGKTKTAEEFKKKFGETRSADAIKHRCGLLGLRVSEERKKQIAAENTNRHYPVGTRQEKTHGEIYEKTERGWKRVKDLVYGDKPKGYIIVHLNGDVKDNSKENLEAISRRVNGRMSKNKFWSESRTITKTGIMVCILEDEIAKSEADK